MMRILHGYINKSVCCLLFFLLTVASPWVQAKNQTVNLTIAYKTVHFAGRSVQAVAVNNQIPGPTLHFKEGDHVTINVYNHIDRGTSIHWHGIIVPWKMDGVEGVTQQPIAPGCVFHYKFTLHQYGTYWYHAHSEFQEQEGVYGGIIIDPPKQRLHYDKDFVIVLSDWNNANPNKVYANLKKEGDFYAINKPMQPSLLQFFHDYGAAVTPPAKQNILDAYKMMQTMRMSVYDISDVSYDAFLLNGRTLKAPWTARVNVGDTVRLRFIGAGANTTFRIKIPNTSMQIISADGNDVKPYRVQNFTIAPGETYDVLVKITKKQPYIIYTESADSLGQAVGALLTKSHQKVNFETVKPFPKPKPVMMMRSMDMSSHASMGKATAQPMSSKVMANHAMTTPNQTSAQTTDDNTMDHASSHTMAAMPPDNEKVMENHAMTTPNQTSAQTTDHNTMDHASTHTMAAMPPDNEKVMANHAMTTPNQTSAQTTDDNTMDHASSHAMAAMPPDNEHGSQHNPTHTMTRHTKTSHDNQNTDALSSPTKYDLLQSVIKTNNPDQPVHIINMKLGGYMDRYIWFLNGLPFYKAKPIMIQRGQWYRIVFTNDTMMSHPMHIHGHWFILRNGHGAYDPKLHTIDVPPGATVVADIHADQSGQWFFHCHNLLHMKAGMTNIFRYEETPQKDFVGLSGNKNVDWFYSNELEMSGDFFNNTYEGSLDTLIGSDYNKLQLNAEDVDIENGAVESANMDLFYWRLVSQFWAIKGGLNYVYRPADTPYVQAGIGIEGLLPYFIETDVRAYLHDDSAKLDVQIARNTQLAHRLFIRLSVDSIFATKTITDDEIGRGLNSLQWIIQPYYQFNPNLALYIQYQYQDNYGPMKNILIDENESVHDNSYSLGISLLF